MSNENEVKGVSVSAGVLNFACTCILIISAWMAYDILLNNQASVTNRAHTSAHAHAYAQGLPLERTVCEYSANLEGLTACNLYLNTGGILTMMCVGGFYRYTALGDIGCYPVKGWSR